MSLEIPVIKLMEHDDHFTFAEKMYAVVPNDGRIPTDYVLTAKQTYDIAGINVFFKLLSAQDYRDYCGLLAEVVRVVLEKAEKVVELPVEPSILYDALNAVQQYGRGEITDSELKEFGNKMITVFPDYWCIEVMYLISILTLSNSGLELPVAKRFYVSACKDTLAICEKVFSEMLQ